jgi:acetate kinase
MRVLVVNAGSSSLKLSVLDETDRLTLSESLPVRDGRLDDGAIRSAIASVEPIDAVGHRIVHGGSDFVAPVRIDDDVIRQLHALTDLAPLHLPSSLNGLEIVRRALPDVPAVACFDTAFHARMPKAASTLALPLEWRMRWNLRRFGFHGLSHDYASGRAAEMAGVPVDRFRVVTCHLGAGASLAAVRNGVSVDTTMGFTPLDGLVMATRSGSVDPGLILWLEEHIGMAPAELASALEHRSGLYGLTGTADMRAILEAEDHGDADAGLAVGVYLHRLRGAIASMTAAMDGLDAVVFTGGVGERSTSIRARAAEGLGFLGIEVDAERNRQSPDAEIGAPGARVRVFVIEAREDLQIVRAVRLALSSGGDS